jgi:hypothetical protein
MTTQDSPIKFAQTRISHHNLGQPSFVKFLKDILGYPNFVYAGFRDARRDIQDPPVAQSARASPNHPHDEELMDARPDQEEMEEAINRFLLQMEKQEKKGFKDLASVLSQLPKPAQGTVPVFPLFPWPTRSRLVFFQQWIKIRPTCSLRRSFTCTDTLRTTG